MQSPKQMGRKRCEEIFEEADLVSRATRFRVPNTHGPATWSCKSPGCVPVV